MNTWWFGTLLMETVSALCAMLVFVVWLRPTTFRTLLDRDNNDYPSLGRQGQFTAMIVSTWVLIAEAITSHVSEWLFGGYMLAWAGAQFGSAYLKIKGQQVGTVSTESSTSTTTTVAPKPARGESP